MEKQTNPLPIIGEKTVDNISQTQIKEFNNQQVQTICNRSQIHKIVSFILSLEDYYKIVSLDIQHHQSSINTLPSSLLIRFPQLTKRVETIINKSKFNVDFINRITEPYNQFVYNHLLEKKEKLSCVNRVSSHTHNCHNHHQNHTLIMNIFYSLVRQWSLFSNLNYIQTITFHIQSYLKNSLTGGENKSIQQNTKILIVSCGMGRIMKQLRKQFHQRKIFIQGHQSQIQLYLCAEYFLNRCREQSEVYPYIHNFSNFLNSQDPYRSIVVPYQIQSEIMSYPLTFGNFTKIYEGHQQNWSIIVTVFNNYNIEDVLLYLKLIYKMLVKGGIWIDLCTASFDKNVIQMTYRQYEFILNSSKFKLLVAEKFNGSWFHDHKCLLNQTRVSYCRVMQK